MGEDQDDADSSGKAISEIGNGPDITGYINIPFTSDDQTFILFTFTYKVHIPFCYLSHA